MGKSIISINLSNSGSTGKIADLILKTAEHSNWLGWNAYPERPENKKKKSNDIIISSYFQYRLNRKSNYLFGLDSSFNIFCTSILINKIKKTKPSIVHLHNIHGSFLNINLLFKYFKNSNIKVIWTLHDCWSFTGRCPHFTMSKCDRWKTGCFDCPYPKKNYPQAMIDRTKQMWNKKKELFTGLNLTIVTPSQWLADLVKQSFLKDYPVKVINNGIDLSVFKPAQSDFREKYNLQNKFVLLGVAFDWGVRKGLDAFIELSKRLDSDKFQIVLVGTNDEIDKQLPKNIISIHRTHNQKELAEIYSACDLFVNPTREENYPTVNMESIACGTPVLTFRTGGSPEILTDKTGSIVDCDDIDGMEKEIIRIEKERPFKKEDCLENAKSFDMNERFKEYVDLYNGIVNEN